MRLALLALLLTGVIGCGLESGRPAEDWKSDTENGGAAESDSEFTVTLDAAENGDAAAQRNLANMYRHGQGVAKDNAEAEKWYRRAAEQGDAEAQYNLGVIYRYGRGVPKDNTEAVKWYRKAAEQGDTKGQFVLGNMYYDGRGVPKDQAEAVKWWRKAAEQGSANGQWGLGIAYRHGDGVPQDDVEAYIWFSIAATNGDVVAKKQLSEVKARLTPEQLIAADERAAELTEQISVNQAK